MYRVSMNYAFTIQNWRAVVNPHSIAISQKKGLKIIIKPYCTWNILDKIRCFVFGEMDLIKTEWIYD
jgi:hypothetical protein